jgi:chitosanase
VSAPRPAPSRRARLRILAVTAVGAIAATAALVVNIPAHAAFTSSPLTNRLSNTCLDVKGWSNAPGTPVEIWTCHGGDNQKFTTVDGQIRVTINGVTNCLDADGRGTGNGTRIIIWTCHGGNNQQWTHNGDNSIRGVGSGRCIDLNGGGTHNGNGVVLWDCKNGGNGSQTWTPNGGQPPGGQPPAGNGVNLDDPRKKDVAMQLVSTAENSSTDWRAQFGYIEDIGDDRGYTAGIIGFCSGTGDMFELVKEYTRRKPGNVLAGYLGALEVVRNGSHEGLGGLPEAWRTAAGDPVFRQAQEDERDRLYFNPALNRAKGDGVRALGQFAYYDAAVMHGEEGMKEIRNAALRRAKPPAQGGDETAWLNAFLDARVAEMKTEAAHEDVSRVETAQRWFLREPNLDLNTPLRFEVYKESFIID